MNNLFLLLLVAVFVIGVVSLIYWNVSFRVLDLYERFLYL
jgi:hypothetical protein